MSSAAVAIPPYARPLPRQPGTVLLQRISWEAYRTLAREVGDEAIHLTYDNGLLEIEVPSERHEQLKAAVRTMVEDTLKALRVRFEPLGSTKWDSQERLQGIEADECYYVQNEPAVRGKRPIDLSVCPPPDLAIEVEVSASSLDKLSLYASLGIPEVWRVRDEGFVSILLRNERGEYVPSTVSRAVPPLPPQLVAEFLRSLEPLGPRAYADLVEAFQGHLDAIRVRRP